MKAFLDGFVRLVVIFLMTSALPACTGQIDRRGHVFSDTDIEQIQQGMSKQQVQLAYGTPDTTSAIGGGGAYYYISTTEKRPVSFAKPTVVERKILAVYFDENDTVKQVANYGLKDGKVFDFIKRKTPSHGNDASIVQQLFRNLGNRQILGGGGSSGY